jgi:hypothetical protein
MHGSHTLIVLVVLGLIDAVMVLGQTMIDSVRLKEAPVIKFLRLSHSCEALSNQVLFVN